MIFENHFPRAVSVMCCMSVTRPLMFRNCGTGAISFVSLFTNIPFGTALGIYTLWVLLPAEAEQEYNQESRAA